MSDKPSVGAMRAAEALHEAANVAAAHWRDSPGVTEVAAIIDEQTGLPDLLAALNGLVQAIGTSGRLLPCPEPMAAAYAAIAKTKGQSNNVDVIAASRPGETMDSG